MPDIHQGYGFPIGGVVATRLPEGVISPGGVGYDINCGVRLLVSLSQVEEIRPNLEAIASHLYANCPSGVGAHGCLHLSNAELDSVLHDGSRWMLQKGYASREDLDRTEEFGRIRGADAAFVSDRACERGLNQLGTLGAGNHFIEVDRIAEVYDPATAARLGIYSGNVAVQIHCGACGFGHQICEDYVRQFQKTVRDYGIDLPDRELVCAPFDSKEGQEYFQAMACAAHFAFANRQLAGTPDFDGVSKKYWRERSRTSNSIRCTTSRTTWPRSKSTISVVFRFESAYTAKAQRAHSDPDRSSFRTIYAISASPC